MRGGFRHPYLLARLPSLGREPLKLRNVHNLSRLRGFGRFWKHSDLQELRKDDGRGLFLPTKRNKKRRYLTRVETSCT